MVGEEKHNTVVTLNSWYELTLLYALQPTLPLLQQLLESLTLVPVAYSPKSFRKSGEKRGRPELIHHVNDVRWMWGEGSNHKNNALDHPFQQSTTVPDSVKLLVLTGKKTCFQILFEYHSFFPYVHLMATHVMNESRPSPFFFFFLLLFCFHVLL